MWSVVFIIDYNHIWLFHKIQKYLFFHLSLICFCVFTLLLSWSIDYLNFFKYKKYMISYTLDLHAIICHTNTEFHTPSTVFFEAPLNHHAFTTQFMHQFMHHTGWRLRSGNHMQFNATMSFHKGAADGVSAHNYMFNT